jgi:hypothetical protein
MHNSGAITPPATPTSSHSRTYSASSDFLTSLSSLRRGDSTSSLTSRPSLDETPRPGSTELLAFPYLVTDYTVQTDSKGRRTPIGSGAWSDVYLATPSLPLSPDRPITPDPVPSRTKSKANVNVLSLYAIKVPSSTSAKKVLDAEARILSYLSRFPCASTHIVPFHGLDARTHALVLGAMDCTLDTWADTHLNTLNEAARAATLAAVFPRLAHSLLDSLAWLHDKQCVHADIKLANILLSNSTPVFSDFSSSILTHIPSSPPSGAGTWDFLDPSLLSPRDPASPSTATDLWALGVTLLSVVLGGSPYKAFGANKFQQREIIKNGDPLGCVGYGDDGDVLRGRLKGLSGALGWDVESWFARVLVKDNGRRVGIEAWRAELVGRM